MASDPVPALIEALFIYRKKDVLGKATKAALRLCNKHFESLVDATVVEAEKYSDDLNLDLNALLNTEWRGIKKLKIMERRPGQNSLTELPSALFVKFSRLETLEISYCNSLKALPEEIGELSHLKELKLHTCYCLSALPSSLGQLSSHEEVALTDCSNLTVESIAPLQHLTGLTSLTLSNYRMDYKINKYPDFICNLTSLKTLYLYSLSVKTLPVALGNLTNLESLDIRLGKLIELPKSIGNLNALKLLNLCECHSLTTLPESFDDLLWRKAHEKEELKKMELVDFRNCPNVVFSPKMKQALEMSRRNGVHVIIDNFLIK